MSEKKENYKKSIIKQLYFGNVMSCAEISERINKSLPLTNKILQELIKEDYIDETGLAPSSGGRRPATYSLRPGIQYIVSVAMDQFVTRIVIMDVHNKYVTGVEKFEMDIWNNPNPIFELAEKIEEYINSSGIPKAKIAGIGIGMPGFVDSAKGINYSFQEPLYNIPEYISAKTGLDVFIDNDSSLIALAELRFGKAINKSNAMVLNVGWGIGLGLVLNGNLFRGYNGFAGEFSHISLFTNDKICTVCGKTGCLETESSLTAMVDKTRKAIKNGRTSALKDQVFDTEIEDAFGYIMKAAQKGDQLAIENFSEAGYNIGKGVAILIHLLNPETIILSGRGSLAGKIWKASIQQALNEHCIPRLAASTEIELSSLGYEAELIGSAALVMENYGNGQLNDVMQAETETQLQPGDMA
ncbi:MAG TPA: ROK family transcriptional regulator [Chitinophagaceae bacterium]|nr:ROK family transcriptional regulator [Chitinophagaceae bacterium]